MNGSYIADIANQILFLVILANSLNLLLGLAGQLSMATAAFYGVGAYTLAIVTATAGAGSLDFIDTQWPFWVGLLSAIVVSILAGFGVAILAARRVRGDYLILLTLAFQFLFSNGTSTFVSLTGGPNGMPVMPISIGSYSIDTTDKAFWLFLPVTIVVSLLCSFLASSPFGRLLRGIREDEGVVRALGKTTVAPKSLAFAITAGLAGAIGALSAGYTQFVAPATYNLDFAVLVAACVALGGPGNILGSTIAAFVIGSIRPIMENWVGMTSNTALPWISVVFGCLLVLGIRFRPMGIFPEGMHIFGKRAARTKARDAGHDGDFSGSKRVVDACAGTQPIVGGEPDAVKSPVMEARDLSKRYGGLQAVEKFSMNLYAGEIVALIGPNGAGKSTIFNLLTDDQPSDSGSVMVRGKPMIGLSPAKIAQNGMVRYFQGVRPFGNMTALDNVALAVPGQPGERLNQLFRNPLAVRRTEKEVRRKALELLTFVGVEDIAHEKVQDLSFGQQKLVAFARLIATGGDILLLDEPASGVDPRAAERIIALVRKLAAAGKAICIVEHSLHFVTELADRVVFMNAGRIVAEGSVGEVTSRSDLIDLYFGT